MRNKTTRAEIAQKGWCQLDSTRTLQRFVCSENTTDPAIGTNRPHMFCLATATKKITRNYGQLVPLCVAVFACSTQRSAPRFHCFTHNSLNSTSTSGECIHLPRSWGDISSPRCGSLTGDSYCCCLLTLFSLLGRCPTIQRMRQWCLGIRKALRGCFGLLYYDAVWTQSGPRELLIICFWTKQNSAGVKAA